MAVEMLSRSFAGEQELVTAHDRVDALGRRQMAREDVEAGMSISLILSGVIFLGLLGMIVTVLWIL